MQRDLLLFNAIATSGECESCLFNFEVHASTISVAAGVDRPYDEWGFRSWVGWRSERRPLQRLVEPSLGAEGAGVILDHRRSSPERCELTSG